MDHHTPIEAPALLVAILRAIVDTHPLERMPELPWQISIVTERHACLWDARDDSSQAIAEAISGQFGTVVAAVSAPLVGVLIESDDIEEAAPMLTASYGAATGAPPDAEHPF